MYGKKQSRSKPGHWHIELKENNGCKRQICKTGNWMNIQGYILSLEFEPLGYLHKKDEKESAETWKRPRDVTDCVLGNGQSLGRYTCEWCIKVRMERE